MHGTALSQLAECTKTIPPTASRAGMSATIQSLRRNAGGDQNLDPATLGKVKQGLRGRNCHQTEQIHVINKSK
jgi:hypothetical protein